MESSMTIKKHIVPFTLFQFTNQIHYLLAEALDLLDSNSVWSKIMKRVRMNIKININLLLDQLSLELNKYLDINNRLILLSILVILLKVTSQLSRDEDQQQIKNSQLKIQLSVQKNTSKLTCLAVLLTSQRPKSVKEMKNALLFKIKQICRNYHFIYEERKSNKIIYMGFYQYQQHCSLPFLLQINMVQFQSKFVLRPSIKDDGRIGTTFIDYLKIIIYINSYFFMQRDNFSKMNFLLEFADKLQNAVKQRNSNGQYYFAVEPQNILILDHIFYQQLPHFQFQIMIDAIPIQMFKWNANGLQKQKESVYFDHRIIHNYEFRQCDYWWMGWILLQSCSQSMLRYQQRKQSRLQLINRGMQIQQLIEQMLEKLDDESVDVDDRLLDRICDWFRSSHIAVGRQREYIDAQNRSESKNTKITVLKELNPLKRLKQRITVGMNQLQNFMEDSKSDIQYFYCTPLTTQNVLQYASHLYDNKDRQFLKSFGYKKSSKQFITHQEKQCPRCQNIQIVIESLDCNHGECISCKICYLVFDQIREISYLTCMTAKCQAPITIQFLDVALSNKASLKTKYLKLMIDVAAKRLNSNITKCKMKQCQSQKNQQVQYYYIHTISKAYYCGKCRTIRCTKCDSYFHGWSKCDFKQLQLFDQYYRQSVEGQLVSDSVDKCYWDCLYQFMLLQWMNNISSICSDRQIVIFNRIVDYYWGLMKEWSNLKQQFNMNQIGQLQFIQMDKLGQMDSLVSTVYQLRLAIVCQLAAYRSQI